MSMVVDVLPPEFVAVIVYVVKVESALGVPLISPVDASIFKPVGSPGLIDQLTTGPPPTFGIPVVIGVPFVSTNEVPV